MSLKSLRGSPRMSLGAQLCVQETQLVQLAFLDLIRMSFQLVDIPIDAQKPTLDEVRLGRIQPEGKAARKRLCILRKRRESVDDHAPIFGSHDAGMDGEDTDVRILWTAFVLVNCQR